MCCVSHKFWTGEDEPQIWTSSSLREAKAVALVEVTDPDVDYVLIYDGLGEMLAEIFPSDFRS